MYIKYDISESEKEQIDKFIDKYKDEDYFVDSVLETLYPEQLLDSVDTSDCYWKFGKDLLDEFDDDTLIDYIEGMGYKVIENDDNYLLPGEDNISHYLNMALDYMTTKSYLTKEEKKELICDYIDFWF